MQANTQERECVLFNRSIKWTSQTVANLYAELVGPPYSLEGREGMRKGQFQQLMHQIKVPMPRTGPFSSTMNDRLFNMFDKRKSARVSLEDLLHALHVLSSDSKKDKLTLAFKAFDMGNKGFVTLGEMASAIKDITNILYVGKKIPTPERVRQFATGVMAEHNDEREEADYVVNAEQFVASAMESAQIANLFSLGSVAADDAKSSDDGPDHESSTTEESVSATGKRTAAPPTETPKPKPMPTSTATGDAGGRGVGRGMPPAGRGMPPPAARGRGGAPSQQSHGRGAFQHHDDATPVAHAGANVAEVRVRRRSSGERDPRDRISKSGGEGKTISLAVPTAAAGGSTGVAAAHSPRGPKPSTLPDTSAVAEKPRPRKDSFRSEPSEGGGETMEEMNARLVAHIRALQVELRKYMDFDKDNKQELEHLRSQVQELTTENTQLKTQLTRASQESKQLIREQEKDKDQKARALTRKVGEMEHEMAKQRDMEREFAGVLQFLVGPPIEQKVATTLQDVRVLKCSSMVKRGELIKSWKRRMFILRENMQLIYYAADERPQPRGVLDLRTVVVVRVPKDAPANVIEIITNSRQWFVACDTEEEAKEWCKLLNHMVETNKLRPAVGAERILPNFFS